MYRLSVYGKGGVGKSTVSANVSFILSGRGLKVFHIGCDPKHDSARLLTEGRSQKTFLDCMAEKDGEPIVLGSNGVACLECGGAEPGIGCAGKGMSAMFTYAEENAPADTDVRVCDVLGDVVCGGFGVPMRRSNVDGIIIVVSEDFMSLYAANNILRGIRNLNGTACVIGMVLNSRYPEGRKRVELFSEATGVPVIGEISTSRAFADAEARGRTVAELYPDSVPASELNAIVDSILEVKDGKRTTVEARPLNDNAMTQIAAAVPVTDFTPPSVRKQCEFDTVDEVRGLVYKGGQAMPACTSHGAVHFLHGIRDAAIILHGPRNCSWLMSYAWRRDGCTRMRNRNQMIPDNLYSTAMDSRILFGGDRDSLQNTVRRAYDDGFRTAFVVLTCTPETIGTDPSGECERIDLPGMRVIPVPLDPRPLSSKLGGREGAMAALSTVIEETVVPEKDTVCLLGVTPRLDDVPDDRRVVEEILGAYGLRIRTVFPDINNLSEIENLRSCEYFIVPARGPMTKLLTRYFAKGCKVIYAEHLAGIRGVRDWCAMLAEATGRDGNGYLERVEKQYREMLAPYRARLEGKTALLYNRDYMTPDSVIDTILDLGMKVPAYVSWPDHFEDRNERVDRHPEIPRVKNVERCHLRKMVEEYGADVVISGDPRTGNTGVPWTGFFAEGIGHIGSVMWARKLCNSLAILPKQTWRL